MQVFGTDSYRSKLSTSLTDSKETVLLISAYITIEGMEWVLDKINENVNCKILTRWNCNDLISGASDIEVYQKLNERGYSLYILPDLHAKVTVVDYKELFLGSANVTNSGLKLVPGGNREIGTLLIPDEQDINLIEALFNEAIFVSKELYQDFYAELQVLKQEVGKPAAKRKWSIELLNKLKELNKPPEKIWVTEVLWSSNPNELLNGLKNIKSSEVLHDLDLLGFDSSSVEHLTMEDIRNAFLKTRTWHWLKNKLNSTPNKEMYYGQLTQELHNSFLDDPAPYRKNVKSLLSNLLQWTTSLANDFVVTDRPNHSERIRLKSN